MFQADSPPTLCRRAHPKCSVSGSSKEAVGRHGCPDSASRNNPGERGSSVPRADLDRRSCGEKERRGGGWGGGGGGKRKIIYLSLHRHHQNDSWIKMGSDESHFNVSVGSDGQSHKTVSTDHNLLLFSLWMQRKRSGPPFPSASVADSSLLAMMMMMWSLMSSDVGLTNCDQWVFMVHCCFTSTETIRLIRTGSPGRPPRRSHSSWTLREPNIPEQAKYPIVTVFRVAGRPKKQAEPDLRTSTLVKPPSLTDDWGRQVTVMILPQVHLRKPCYGFYFLWTIKFERLLDQRRRPPRPSLNRSLGSSDGRCVQRAGT